jgi:hypothetical protein
MYMWTLVVIHAFGDAQVRGNARYLILKFWPLRVLLDFRDQVSPQKVRLS